MMLGPIGDHSHDSIVSIQHGGMGTDHLTRHIYSLIPVVVTRGKDARRGAGRFGSGDVSGVCSKKKNGAPIPLCETLDRFFTSFRLSYQCQSVYSG